MRTLQRGAGGLELAGQHMPARGRFDQVAARIVARLRGLGYGSLRVGQAATKGARVRQRVGALDRADVNVGRPELERVYPPFEVALFGGEPFNLSIAGRSKFSGFMSFLSGGGGQSKSLPAAGSDTLSAISRSSGMVKVTFAARLRALMI